jgi:hypothetical protein
MDSGGRAGQGCGSVAPGAAGREPDDSRRDGTSAAQWTLQGAFAWRRIRAGPWSRAGSLESRGVAGVARVPGVARGRWSRAGPWSRAVSLESRCTVADRHRDVGSAALATLCHHDGGRSTPRPRRGRRWRRFATPAVAYLHQARFWLPWRRSATGRVGKLTRPGGRGPCRAAPGVWVTRRPLGFEGVRRRAQPLLTFFPEHADARYAGATADHAPPRADVEQRSAGYGSITAPDGPCPGIDQAR